MRAVRFFSISSIIGGGSRRNRVVVVLLLTVVVVVVVVVVEEEKEWTLLGPTACAKKPNCLECFRQSLFG